MEFDINLFNATVVGENPETGLIVEGNKLHAVEKHIAEIKKDKSNPALVLPLLRDALRGLAKHAQGKVPPHFTDIDWDAVSKSRNEQAELIRLIENIYTHLHHYDRNDLSTLIHHPQIAKGRR